MKRARGSGRTRPPDDDPRGGARARDRGLGRVAERVAEIHRLSLDIQPRPRG